MSDVRRLKRSTRIVWLSATGSLLVATALVWPSQGGGSQAGSTEQAQQIVAEFFPQSIINGPEATPGTWVAEKRESAFVVLERLPDGRPGSILAAYTNGIAGAIRLIRAEPDGNYTVTFEPSGLDVGGFKVGAELLDMDGDTRPEAIISFASYRAQTSEWIFRWNGTTLENLTPMLPEELGSRPSQLMLSKFVDLDHDGKLEIVSEENYPPQTDENGFALGGSLVFRLGAAGYVLDRPVLYWGEFVRRTGPPQAETHEFTLLADSTGPYMLKLVNGDANGNNRVSSARIVLNGTEILSSNQFSQQVHFLDIAASLAQSNTIQVTLAGQPLGHVWITIQDESAVQAAQQPGAQP